jgi:hypothetical protein
MSGFYSVTNERNFRVYDPFLRVTNEVEELRLQLNSCNVDIGLNCCATGTRGPFFLPATGSIAIGCEAANSTTGSFGYQFENAIALGHRAGQYSQRQEAIAIGYRAGQVLQNTYTVAIGETAGRYYQKTRSVAVGAEAGYENQENRCVAVGRYAGKYNQGFDEEDSGHSIAVGSYAANYDQAPYAIAIGNDAGYENQQRNAIAIGNQAGDFLQGTGATAIGYQAGYSNQGEYSVCIGYEAGSSSAPSNSIIINANATDLNASNSGLYIKPIRETTFSNVTPLFYQPSSGEILRVTNSTSDGQVLRMVMLAFNQIGQTGTTNLTSVTNFASYSYTPLCSSSILIVEYCTTYYAAGTNSDNYASRIQVNGSDITTGIQYASNDGAGRSSILFPLMGRYNNTDSSAKTIEIGAGRTSGDDALDVYGNNGTWLKITELFVNND